MQLALLFKISNPLSNRCSVIFQCDQCDKVFSKKGHLDRHIKTIHMGMKEESQPCPHCGKVFSTKSSLEPHIMMVHQGMRKKCPECGKVLSDLWKHMRTMHGQYRRRTKISKEEALENNLVPKDTKSRVNVKVLYIFFLLRWHL